MTIREARLVSSLFELEGITFTFNFESKTFYILGVKSSRREEIKRMISEINAEISVIISREHSIGFAE